MGQGDNQTPNNEPTLLSKLQTAVETAMLPVALAYRSMEKTSVKVEQEQKDRGHPVSAEFTHLNGMVWKYLADKADPKGIAAPIAKPLGNGEPLPLEGLSETLANTILHPSKDLPSNGAERVK